MEGGSPFKADILKGKVALLTGGASGIGFEISLQFGKHGASVALMGRRNSVLDSAVSTLQSLGIPVISPPFLFQSFSGHPHPHFLLSKYNTGGLVVVFINCLIQVPPHSRVLLLSFRSIVRVHHFGSIDHGLLCLIIHQRL